MAETTAQGMREFPEDPEDCEHGRWNPDNNQCLDCGDVFVPGAGWCSPELAAQHAANDRAWSEALGHPEDRRP